MRSVEKSYCRTCPYGCAVEVEVEDGRALRVSGDRSDPVYQGYSCVKGRAEAELLNSPDRLLRTLQRGPDGSFRPIAVADAVGEIADHLRRIIDRHGPRAVATYLGTKAYTSSATLPLAWAFMEAIGSPMRFTAETIDKPGKPIARAMLGHWMAPPYGFHDPDVAIFIGLNPLVAYQGIPCGHPGKWLRHAAERGLRMVVIDPRRTEIARRAAIHLQPRPGHDAAILASMLRVVIEEDLHDAPFVTEDVRGFAALRRAVSPFTPDAVAARAGIDADDLVAAARLFGNARRGYIVPGTGPIMSAPGPLADYLALCLDTVCGHWMRAGEAVPNPGVLHPTPSPVAQAAPPMQPYGFGERLRVRDLRNSVAGMPTGALPDEMLLEGDGRVRALISVGGNPALAWPDQDKAVRSLDALDLFVQIDPWMSASAERAHYVIAPKLPYEVPSATLLLDDMRRNVRGMGLERPYGHYTPAICDPPPGSDLIAEWELFYELARRMDVGRLVVSRSDAGPAEIDLATTPTTDDIFDLLTEGSRVPLSELRAARGGHLHPAPDVVVAPKQAGWEHRLDVGHPDMMADLAAVASGLAELDTDADDELRLVCRRMQHVYNSSGNHPAANHGRSYNPAFMHPDDLRRLGIRSGDRVDLSTSSGSVEAIAEADETLRPGLISMTHCYGRVTDVDIERDGSNSSRLLSNDKHFDRYAGQPRMSNVPVRVTRLAREIATS